MEMEMHVVDRPQSSHNHFLAPRASWCDVLPFLAVTYQSSHARCLTSRPSVITHHRLAHAHAHLAMACTKSSERQATDYGKIDVGV
jgi:hypothetical protein